jgi:hypothetical protein
LYCVSCGLKQYLVNIFCINLFIFLFQVTFSDPSMQRDHYKTDWHRYNLKRKVAEMPPVSKDAFEQKMSTHETQRKMMSGEIKEPTGYCAPCRKNFNTQSAYQNHLGSKKHRETAAQFEQKEGKVTRLNCLRLLEVLDQRNAFTFRKPSKATA